MKIEDRFKGALIGSALGDCIGQLAFYCRTKDMLEEQLQQKDVLSYTDDTAMTIGLTESLLENEGNVVCQELGKKFHKNYLRESNRGYALGPPTIFSTVERTGKTYVEIAKRLFNNEGSYGNGAAMRITPIGLLFFDSSVIYHEVKKSAMVTHAHPLGIDGAALLAKTLSWILEHPECAFNNEECKEVVKMLINFSQTNEFKANLYQLFNLLEDSTSLRKVDSVLGSNVTALYSVPFVIYSFLKTPILYKKALFDAIIVAKDKDTIGAMLGGLLGAHNGINKIPEQWIDKLENQVYIESLAKKLFNLKYRIE